MNPRSPGSRNDNPERRSLALTNDGALSVAFVGAGSAFSKRFYQNNILIVKGQDHLLVDCGTRTPEALHHLGLSVTQISNYLVTHSHADHVGGLEEVMLVNRYGPRKKTTMVVTDKMESIVWNHCLKGGSGYNEIHDGKPLDFADFWNVIRPKKVRGADRELCEARIGGLEVRLFRTMHIPDSAAGWADSFPSYGLLLDRRVLFTSDTRFDPGLIADMERDYELEAIFHDCQLFTGGVHASLEEIAALPASTKAKTRVMHYGDRIDEFRDRVAELGFAGVVAQWEPYEFPARARS